MGLPPTAKFYETSPVQLFDFSRRARCVHPVKVLVSHGNALDPKEFAAHRSENPSAGGALVLPVGDALQEPNWTEGLGINRGFHTAMNQAYACLLAREQGLSAGIRDARVVYDSVLKMK